VTAAESETRRERWTGRGRDGHGIITVEPFGAGGAGSVCGSCPALAGPITVDS